MQSTPFNLDRILHDILTEEEITCFTIMELRDYYLNRLKSSKVARTKLRMHIYDQIRRMIRVGWVRYDEEKRKRGQVFWLLEQPESLELKLMDFDHPRDNLISSEQNRKVSHSSSLGLTPPKDDTAARLQSMLNETRLDFLSALGEVERYKNLIDEIPELQTTLEPDLLAAQDGSSKLLGHIRALETTLKRLEVQ